MENQIKEIIKDFLKSMTLLSLLFLLSNCTGQGAEIANPNEFSDEEFSSAELMASDTDLVNELSSTGDSIGTWASSQALAFDEGTAQGKVEQEPTMKYICLLGKKDNVAVHNAIVDVGRENAYIALTVKSIIDGDGDPSNNEREILAGRVVLKVQKNIYVKRLDRFELIDFYAHPEANFNQAIATEIELNDLPLHPGRFRGSLTRNDFFLPGNTPSICLDVKKAKELQEQQNSEESTESAKD